MRNKKRVIFVVCMMSIIVISLLIWDSTQIPLKYQKSIYRNLDNQEETALNTAESINYSAILLKEPFTGSSDPEAYLHPDTYLTNTSANFIDSAVINYYETRYDNMQGRGDPKQIELSYEANVTRRSEFRIFNSPAPEGATWHNTTIVTTTPDGSLMRKESVHMQFFYRNQSGYQMTEWAYDFNFSDCHVIEMKLEYSEVYSPTAAFFSNIEQIVILDGEFNPVLIGVESGMTVA